jgi:hypothetical protein
MATNGKTVVVDINSMTDAEIAAFQQQLSRDNLDETGATIWMRRGGRVG